MDKRTHSEDSKNHSGKNKATRQFATMNNEH